ncbi:hypothetical protein CBR_g38452 [Chara braunii]|uniref:DNA mismatch repair protein MSH3 n=1 Tax=Chara braunii TaxID=69332 RepID=A0A388JNR2_CHABU|nr:hypothetical protein CBR_g38452 [Chara braunii]|eukprot:GBG59427.1 hypothetical protein CBR_g38452 [Chara braunii]
MKKGQQRVLSHFFAPKPKAAVTATPGEGGRSTSESTAVPKLAGKLTGGTFRSWGVDAGGLPVGGSRAAGGYSGGRGEVEQCARNAEGSSVDVVMEGGVEEGGVFDSGGGQLRAHGRHGKAGVNRDPGPTLEKRRVAPASQEELSRLGGGGRGRGNQKGRRRGAGGASAAAAMRKGEEGISEDEEDGDAEGGEAAWSGRKAEAGRRSGEDVREAKRRRLADAGARKARSAIKIGAGGGKAGGSGKGGVAEDMQRLARRGFSCSSPGEPGIEPSTVGGSRETMNGKDEGIGGSSSTFEECMGIGRGPIPCTEGAPRLPNVPPPSSSTSSPHLSPSRGEGGRSLHVKACGDGGENGCTRGGSVGDICGGKDAAVLQETPVNRMIVGEGGKGGARDRSMDRKASKEDVMEVERRVSSSDWRAYGGGGGGGGRGGGGHSGKLASKLMEMENMENAAKMGDRGGRTQNGIGAPKYTPLEQQVLELRSQYPDVLLMVEVGYKYRFFGEDAETAARVLGIYSHVDHNFVTASIPTFRLHVHVRRLVEAGYKVGVVRQTETAAIKAHGANKGGPFSRQLSALYTRATLEAAADLGGGGAAACDDREGKGRLSSYLMCVVERGDGSLPEGGSGGGPRSKRREGRDEAVGDGGFAEEGERKRSSSASRCTAEVAVFAVETATGDVMYGQFSDGVLREKLESCLLTCSPSELLLGTPLSSPTEKCSILADGFNLWSTFSILTNEICAMDLSAAS